MNLQIYDQHTAHSNEMLGLIIILFPISVVFLIYLEDWET